MKKNIQHDNALYRLIFEQSRFAIAAIDRMGFILEAGNAFAFMLGYRKEEMKGLSLSQLIPSGDLSIFEKHADEVCLIDRPPSEGWRSYQKRLVRRDGVIIPAFMTAAPVLDDKNRLLYMLVTAEGIPDHLRMEKALEAGRERYRMMLHASIDGFTIVDEQRLFWEVNDSYCRLVGYSREELLSMSLTDVEVQDSPEMIEARMQKIINSGSDRFTAMHRRKDGEIIDIEASVTFDRVNGYFVSFIRDITDRHRAEEALKSSRASFHGIVEKSDYGIIVADPGGKMEFVNPAAARLLGRDREEMLGSVLDMPLQINTYSDMEIAAPSGGTGVGEIHVTTTEWHEKPAYLAVISDITQRKAVEKALHRRLQLEHMLAGLSSRLIGPQDIRTALEASLEQIREAFNGDRVLAGFLSSGGMKVDSVFESRREGIPSVKDIYEGISPDSLPYLFGTIFQDSPVIFSEPEDIPAHAAAEKELLAKRGVRSLLMLPVHISRKHSGFLSISYLMSHIGSITEDDISILQTAADIIGAALSEYNTSNDFRRSREELRLLTARLESIREEERSRIARELHDELGQNLTALRLEIASLFKKLPRPSKQISDKVGSMLDLVDTTIKSVKRLSSELRPRILDDLGLVTAIQWLIKDFENRTGTTCDCTMLSDDVELGKKLSTTLFRICQEALTNIARHSEASKAFIVLEKDEEKVELEVRDNGVGISEKTLANPLSLGILGIRERVSLLGGTVSIHGAPGRGTALKVTIPLPEREVSGDESADNR